MPGTKENKFKLHYTNTWVMFTYEEIQTYTNADTQEPYQKY
jgi:hypothetical protein